MHIKLTTWNIAEFDEALNVQSPQSEDRRRAIAEQIRQLAPDILCIVEASRDLPALRAFIRQELGDAYEVPVLPGTDEAFQIADTKEKWRVLSKLYRLPNRAKSAAGPAAQWIWFLVRRGLNSEPGLVAPTVFDAFARSQFEDEEDREAIDGRWRVYWWNDEAGVRHSYDRHPQVLSLKLAGQTVEIIGAHLKSKLNKLAPEFADGHLTGPYLRNALSARGKLATEAIHIRKYIDARFGQEPDPRIIVLGDLNDGPGKEFFERKYMLFDLVSNLQGSIFEAKRYLNHALFDYDERLRWTYFLDKADPIDPQRIPYVLLDHILFTQAMTSDTALPRIDKAAGWVEHKLHDTINADRPRNPTSDHKPVSMLIRVAEDVA